MGNKNTEFKMGDQVKDRFSEIAGEIVGIEAGREFNQEKGYDMSVPEYVVQVEGEECPRRYKAGAIEGMEVG
ncbi:MAG: hypothetical protein COA45_08145 [Zetaproteobacteria bacterium]|nr:MAG: hypothetical protein COA45_08145 [Zetaproteobacteria bacterium]